VCWGDSLKALCWGGPHSDGMGLFAKFIGLVCELVTDCTVEKRQDKRG